jgi:hypothetical protein
LWGRGGGAPPKKEISFRDKTRGWKILTFAVSYEVIEISRYKNVEKTMNEYIRKINNFDFRSKIFGWKKSCGMVQYSFNEDPVRTKFVESSDKNPYMKGFLRNLYLRASCYNCPVRSLSSGSDITIGDYWGIEKVLPEFDDDKGVSLVMINSQKGREIYEMLIKDDIQTTYLDAFTGNQIIEKSVVMPVERNIFFSRWQHESLFELIFRLTAFSFLKRIRNKLSVIASIFIKRIGIFPLVRYLKRK